VVDTLRKDAVGAYGAAVATPSMDRMAAEGVRFSCAVAQAPWTVPSIASLLSSKYPAEHGEGVNVRTASPPSPTLPERMRAGGYRTAGFLEVDRPYMRRGFETYEAPLADPHIRFRCAPENRRASGFASAIRWVRKNSDQPFFLMVHSYEVHDYFLGKAEARTYALRRNPGYRGEFGRWEPRSPAEALGDDLVKELLGADDDDIAFVRDLYDSGVAVVDGAIGRLRNALTRRGFASNTVVILTSDHGEGFAPRRHRVGHGGRLHEDLLQVPLIISWPGRIAPGVVAARVQLIDVAPTILSLAGLDAAATGAMACRGRPLLAQHRTLGLFLFEPSVHPAVLPAVPALAEESVWLVLPSGERIRSSVHQLALYGGDLKLIRSGRREELYDVAHDPGEEHDLTGQNSRAAAALHRSMNRFLKELGDVTEQGEDLEDALRSLGYVR
jgi:arylsulfatase A-like enzyme